MLAVPAATFAADNAAVKAMEEYFEFSEYGGATILPEQIPTEDWKKILVIDTRDAEQYQTDHIAVLSLKMHLSADCTDFHRLNNR
jgi:hypothetical protein